MVVKRLHVTAAALAAGLLAGLAAPVTADDTDIYLGADGLETGVRPNILFVLDTSGSMDFTDTGNSVGQTRLERLKEALRTVLARTWDVNAGIMRFTASGGALVYPVTDLDAPDDSAPYSLTVAASASPSSGGILDIGSDEVTVTFEDVLVPEGATIDGAWIEFTAVESTAGTDPGDPSPERRPFPDPADNADAFQISTDQAPLLAPVLWNGTNGLSEWVRERSYRTANLAGMLESVVASGWCDNNDVSFQIKRDASSTRSIARRVYGPDYQHSEAGAFAGFRNGPFTSRKPVLRVSYRFDGGGSGCLEQSMESRVSAGDDDATELSTGAVNTAGGVVGLDSGHVNGFRFQVRNIPAGAQIERADVLLTPVGGSAGAPVSWTAEDSAESDSFRSVRNDISTREAVAGSGPSAPTAEADGRLAYDVTGLLQALVNGTGWDTEAEISLIAQASAPFEVEAYDSAPADAAALRITYKASDPPIPARTRLLQEVDDLPAGHVTPIVSSLYEAARYFRGEDVVYGAARSSRAPDYWYSNLSNNDAGNPAGVGNIVEVHRSDSRMAHPGSYTAAAQARDPLCVVNPRDPSCTGESITGARYISPIEEACQANYIVLLTDGGAREPYVRDAWPPKSGERRPAEVLAAEGSRDFALDCSARDSETCGRELVEFLNTEDQRPDLPGDQTVRTFTVAFTLDEASAEYGFTDELAEAGGGGSAKAAETVEELVTAFQSILAEIESRPGAFAAPATTVNAYNRLESGLDVYYAVFNPSERVAWEGNFKKYRICTQAGPADCAVPGSVVGRNGELLADTNGTLSGELDFFAPGGTSAPASLAERVKTGGAASRVPGYAARNIYTYTGGYDASGLTGNPALAASENLLDVNNDTRITVGGTEVDALAHYLGVADSERDTLIQWVRGRDIDDADIDGDLAENRYAFGDPMHATAAVVTYGFSNGSTGEPVQAAFLPTNDGGLRMLNATTGEELWMWIPQELLGMQRARRVNLADEGGQHIYGLDLTPTVYARDCNNNGIIEPTGADSGCGSGADFVRLILGMRDGGRNYYALDVTPGTAGSLNVSPQLLWVIRGGEDPAFANLEYTWSQPLVTSMQVGGTPTAVAIFGGGLDPSLDDRFGRGGGNMVYVVNATTGALITSIGGIPADPAAPGAPAVQVADMDFSIPSAISVVDTGSSKRLYFGDLGGQVWRVELPLSLPGSPAVQKLATLSQAAGAALVDFDANTRQFFNAPAIVRVRDSQFSNIPRYDLVLLGSGTRQSPRNLATHDRFYAIRDYYTNDARYPLSESSLTDITLNPFQTNADGSRADSFDESALEDFQDGNGWMLDLKEVAGSPLFSDANGGYVGEKVFSRATVAGGVLLFTTYLPEELDDPCSIGAGFSRLYGLNVLTGAPRFANWSDDGDQGVLDETPVTADRFREVPGQGIASSPVVVLVDLEQTAVDGEEGEAPSPEETASGELTALACYGSGGTLNCEEVGSGPPRIRTYWNQQ